MTSVLHLAVLRWVHLRRAASVVGTCFASLLLVGSCWAQSQRDCQTASKYLAEAEVIQELFNNLWGPTKADGDPSLRSNEEQGQESLQTRVDQGLKDCMAGDGSTNACGNYKRIRDAWLDPSTPAGGVDSKMSTDPHDCKIYEPTGDGQRREVDPDQGRPAAGYEQADWDSMYNHEKFHQNRCRSANGPGGDYSPENPSPYALNMRDPQLLAEEEVFAYEHTKAALEDYLKKNCFDPNLRISANMGTGQCGEQSEGVARLLSLAGQALSWVVNTASDWLSIGANGPVETPARGEASVALSGSCGCCDGTTKDGEVRVYGGPGHSILIGTAPVQMGCAQDNTCGGMSGDPHMRTYDGLAYDFMGFGEFVLTRGEEFEVQVRMQPPGEIPATIGTAVAVRLNGDRVTMYAAQPFQVNVDGLPVMLEVGNSFRLPSGALLARDASYYRLTSSEGFVLEVYDSAGSIYLRVGLPRGTKSVGLLGNLDADTGNDIVSSAANVLTQPVDFETLYQLFGAGWRVTAETSLFEYEAGVSADTIGEAAFPPTLATVANLDDDARQTAEKACRSAGVTDPINLEDCVLDVGLTGDEEFAAIAAKQPAPQARLEHQPPAQSTDGSSSADGITMQAPREVIASFPLQVKVGGPTSLYDQLCLAPAASNDGEGCVDQISPGDGAGDATRTVEMTLPSESGAYLIRYRKQDGHVALRISLDVRDPVARLEAADTAAAGGSLDVTCVGECSPNAYMNVVPAGSPDDVLGQHGYMTSPTVTILYLPEEPGEYEIRYFAHPRGVFARKPLRLQ